MGRVAGSYGVRGWIKVVPGGGVLEALAGRQEWWIGGEGYRGERGAGARRHGGGEARGASKAASRRWR